MPPRGSNIGRVTVGLMNRVMDPVIGRSGTPLGPNQNRLAGMLGQEIELSDADALLMSDLGIGTLYGGTYKYVRFRSGDVANTFKRGSLLFWDSAAANQVTSTEALATNVGIAGIQINPTTGSYAVVPGNYGWIYVGGGRIAVAWKAALTVTAAVGLQAIWSTAGAGADNGTVDTLAIATGVSMARFMGIAEVLPVAASITNINMPMVRRRITT